MPKYFQVKFIVLLIFGCANGIPLGLIVSVLNAWLEVAGVSKTTIGLFSLVGIPYILKFLWSPIIDYLSIPILTQKIGHRSAWLIVIQGLLCGSLIKLSSFNPLLETNQIALWAVIVSVFAATQETITDTYRVEVLEMGEQSVGASYASVGYNIGLALAGGITLLVVDNLCKGFDICDDFLNWKIGYMIFACSIFIASIASLALSENNTVTRKVNKYNSVAQYFSYVINTSFVDPLKEFINKHQNWVLILIFITIYRTCDSFISPMINPFLLDIGFSLTDIALVVKTFGFFTTIIGSILGGFLAHRCGFRAALFLSGLAQMLSNIMFILQAQVGNNIMLLCFSIAAENIGGAMAISVFIAYISSLCYSSKFTSIQYSFLMGLSSINYFIASSSSGLVVDYLGWVPLFAISVILGIPQLIILFFLREADVCKVR